MLNAERKDLKPEDILSRVRSAWECRTLWITKEESESGGFNYRIGLHTLNASKHNLKNKSKTLFSEFSENECKVKSLKGAGTWSRSLINKIQKPVLVFGESTIQELVQLARASQQHKKAQRPSAGPAPKPKRKGEKKVQKNKNSFGSAALQKGFSLLKRWTFTIIEQVVRTLIKGFLGILLYIYFFKILQIDQINPQFFASMTSIWDLLSFLLGENPPKSEKTLFFCIASFLILFLLKKKE